MSVPFTLLLRGTTEFFAVTTATGNVATDTTDNAPDAIAEAVIDTNGWIGVRVYGMDGDLLNLAEAYKSASGSDYRGSIPKWEWKPKTLKYYFPADKEAWKALQRAVAKGNGYLCMTNYPDELHPVDEVIPVTMDATTTHTYKGGHKAMTITFRKRPITDQLA